MFIKKLRTVAVLFLIITILSGCSQEYLTMDINNEDVSRIEFHKRPMFKNISKSEDIELVLEQLKSIKYKEKYSEEDINGYIYLIRLFNDSNSVVYQLNINKDYMNVDEGCYKIDSGTISIIDRLCDNLKYGEKHYLE